MPRTWAGVCGVVYFAVATWVLRAGTAILVGAGAAVTLGGHAH